MKEHLVTGVTPGSPAEKLGVRPGDVLLSVNGEPVEDIFDYEFLCREEQLTLLMRGADGRETTLRIEKSEEEDPGLVFDGGLMDEYRSCRNKCIFCFIDQMPPGMRETLYFKDDDSRLSFLQGNYITLTNLSDRDVERIIRYRLSPINISIHTLDPELRCRMLHNRFAGESLKILDRLKEAGIRMNGQIVLCPDWNDGEKLDSTLKGLLRYLPEMESVSVVPVGLTRVREGLEPLRPFTPAEAGRVIDQVEAVQKKAFDLSGLHFVHASDEFYLLAKRELPEEARYDGYLQLENGVGMMRSFLDAFREELGRHHLVFRRRKVSLATGMLPAPAIREMTDLLNRKFRGIRTTVYPIRNDFFGPLITVSGLVTARDLIAQLKGKDLGECLYIPNAMLRSGEDVFLDDVHLSEVSKALGVPVIPTDCDGASLVKALLGRREGKLRGYVPYEPEKV